MARAARDRGFSFRWAGFICGTVQLRRGVRCALEFHFPLASQRESRGISSVGYPSPLGVFLRQNLMRRRRGPSSDDVNSRSRLIAILFWPCIASV